MLTVWTNDKFSWILWTELLLESVQSTQKYLSVLNRKRFGHETKLQFSHCFDLSRFDESHLRWKGTFMIPKIAKYSSFVSHFMQLWGQ